MSPLPHVGLVIGQLTRGGAEGQLYELARRLVDRGHTVTVFCLSSADRPFGPMLQQKGVAVVCLHRRRSFELRRARLLADELRRRRVDVVHSFLFIGNAYAYLACRRAGITRFLPSVRSFEFQRPRLLRLIDRIVLRSASHILVNASYLQDLLPRAYGVPQERIRLIPNGLDLERFLRVQPPTRNREDACVIGSISLFKPEKRIEFLLEVARRIVERRRQARFIIVGDGPERGSMLEYRSALRLEEKVEMPGETDNVAGELSRQHVFLLTSEREGMPNAILEAMAAARPVVASDVVGIAEVVRDGETGLLFPRDDPQAAARHLEALIDSPEMGLQMGCRGREVAVRDHSAQRMVERTMDIYLELTKEGSPVTGVRS